MESRKSDLQNVSPACVSARIEIAWQNRVLTAVSKPRPSSRRDQPSKRNVLTHNFYLSRVCLAYATILRREPFKSSLLGCSKLTLPEVRRNRVEDSPIFDNVPLVNISQCHNKGLELFNLPHQ